MLFEQYTPSHPVVYDPNVNIFTGMLHPDIVMPVLLEWNDEEPAKAETKRDNMNACLFEMVQAFKNPAQAHKKLWDRFKCRYAMQNEFYSVWNYQSSHYFCTDTNVTHVKQCEGSRWFRMQEIDARNDYMKLFKYMREYQVPYDGRKKPKQTLTQLKDFLKERGIFVKGRTRLGVISQWRNW